MSIREYLPKDKSYVIELYQEVFAEPPWNEYMKCADCGVNYGKDEVYEGVEFDRIGVEWRYQEPSNKNRVIIDFELGEKGINRTNIEYRARCKKCGIDLSATIRPILGGAYAYNSENFVPYWSNEDVEKDIEFCLRQETPLFFVAEKNRKIVGFTWGYKLPLQKFSFLEGIVSERTIYVDELAVDKKKRRKSIGTALTEKLLEEARKQYYEDVILRTDVSGVAYDFYLALGFENTGIRDPKYPERTYLKKSIK